MIFVSVLAATAARAEDLPVAGFACDIKNTTQLSLRGETVLLDAVVGLTQGRGFLAPDFSLTNFLVNLPHIVLAGIALVFGFRQSPSLVRSAA